MAYIVGFVVAVPAENKEAYRKHAAHFLPLMKEFGVARMVEVDDDLAEAVLDQQPDVVFENGPSAHAHHGLRKPVGERPQPGALARRENHRLHAITIPTRRSGKASRRCISKDSTRARNP